MKKTISIILLCCCLIVLHTTALAADSITVTASVSKVQAGDSITILGTATADTWISIEGTDADGNILYFSAVLSDGAGAYSVTFKAPVMDDGTLTLAAGNGNMTASTTVAIYTPSAKPSSNPSVTPSGNTSVTPSGNKDTNSGADASATSAQVSQISEISETPGTTGSAVPSVTPAASGETPAATIQPGDAVNSQSPTGTLGWILICVLALLLIVGVILFLRKRKRM